ncbi:hypothetical protein D778_00825 [Xanthomarina gelatinilytica]|uniref:Uncharacterized protein n=1 Tax=Xanthomarina gelatinilytica TaxID=1137281 RepID=M7MDX0_9FLAO|nr:hypothetical protein D778_00825 [Xanthomarina gelatinilytica]
MDLFQTSKPGSQSSCHNSQCFLPHITKLYKKTPKKGVLICI